MTETRSYTKNGPAAGASFGDHVRAVLATGEPLVVQARMGVAKPDEMRRGLLAVQACDAATVGTITVDSFSRTGNYKAVRHAVLTGAPLNGYPIATWESAITRAVVADLVHPVQVRHGTPRPLRIVRAVLASGITATEGGGVSYGLPYGQTPLAESLRGWDQAAELLARQTDGRICHIESFGGSMMGQACPPSLLLAICILEAIGFARQGIADVSLSYAQQTNPQQDLEALAALRRLGNEYLAGVQRHLVVYTWMGVYPQEARSALALLDDSATLAVAGRAQRLIVKTVAEGQRIPTFGENIAALERAARIARSMQVPPQVSSDNEIYLEAKLLVDAVLDLHANLRKAVALAFQTGILDVPYCLHPDNRNLTRTYLDPATGRLHWGETGRLPIPHSHANADRSATSSREFLRMLNYNRDRYDFELPRRPVDPKILDSSMNDEYRAQVPLNTPEPGKAAAGPC